MLLGGIGRFKPQVPGDIGTGGGVSGLVDMLADNIQYLLLSFGEFFHHGHHLGIYTGAVIIYSITARAQQASVTAPGGRSGVNA